VSARSIDELAQAVRQRLDATEQWALEISRNRHGAVTPGGEHWNWVCDDHDIVAVPQPGIDLLLETGECDCFRVSLRSLEEYVDEKSSDSRPLPHFVLSGEEIPSIVAGYLLRYEPARVLADVARQRQMLERLLAEPHTSCDDPGYNCAALGWNGKGNTGDACTCGRDERVRGYLELLAGVDETEAAG
jgi:hypothetical protein